MTAFSVVIPNYRLTVGEAAHLQHPAHAEDILAFLTFLLDWDQRGLGAFDPNRIYLMGHSCSAHMLASIFLDSSSITPSLTPSPALLGSVQGIIMSEGIYDIDLLLSSFPAYRDWFIEAAFGAQSSYPAASILALPLRAAALRWLVIHSKGDTLVDLTQSEKMHARLCTLYGEAADSHVYINTDQLDGEHNDILHNGVYVKICANFITADAAQRRGL